MDGFLWTTGLGFWTAVVAILLWALLSALANAVDASWFTWRCWHEGAMKKPGVGPLWRVWWNSFLQNIQWATSAEGYIIPYPGYPWTPLSYEDE
jgi:hypothetical protein